MRYPYYLPNSQTSFFSQPSQEFCSYTNKQQILMIMFTSSVLRLVIQRNTLSGNHLRRPFSSHTSVKKLQHIFEEYRLHNYPQTTPPRFRKSVLKVTRTEDEGIVAFEEILKLLNNIGAGNHLSQSELEEILIEAGGPRHKRGIPVEKMMALL